MEYLLLAWAYLSLFLRVDRQCLSGFRSISVPFHPLFVLLVPGIWMILNLNAKYAPGCCIFPSRAGNNDYSLQGHSVGEGGGQLANKIIYEMCNIFATSSGSHLYCCFLFYLANCSSVEISRGVRKLVDCLQVTTSGRCSPATARRWWWWMTRRASSRGPAAPSPGSWRRRMSTWSWCGVSPTTSGYTTLTSGSAWSSSAPGQSRYIYNISIIYL